MKQPCFLFAMIALFGLTFTMPRAALAAGAMDEAALGFGLYCATFETEAETTAFIAKCREFGVRALFPSLSGGSTVYWKTDRESLGAVYKRGLDEGYDSLASMIERAHAVGIAVYPSVAVGPAGKLLEQNPEWETRDREGRASSETTTRSVSLAYPEARAAKVRLLMDLVEGYAVDGVMLDYCRYPETTAQPKTAYGFYGYDPPLIQACLAIYGFDPREVPIDSPEWMLFNDMRSASVTTFVGEFRAAVMRSGKHIRVGGFGDTDPERERRMCGRDCPGWARAGLIDDYFLATYNDTIEEMPAKVSQARQLAGDKVMLRSSLAPFNRFLTTNEQMIAAGKAQLAGGADGLWIYRSDFLEDLGLWPGAAAASQLTPQ